MTMIPVQSVKDQRFNRPRSVHTVQTMAASIMAHGQLQPIRVARITTDDARPSTALSRAAPGWPRSGIWEKTSSTP